MSEKSEIERKDTSGKCKDDSHLSKEQANACYKGPEERRAMLEKQFKKAFISRVKGNK